MTTSAWRGRFVFPPGVSPRMLTLRTLGAVFVSGPDGVPISAATAQRRPLALLSILAVADGAGVSRDRLVGLLWPEVEANKARHNLTQALYHSRRMLACDDLFIIAGSTIRLNDQHIENDVAQFTSFLETEDECAAEWYQGEFLEGFFLPGVVDFDHWMSAERTRLTAKADVMFERLAARAEGRDARNGAVHWRSRQVALNPLNS